LERKSFIFKFYLVGYDFCGNSTENDCDANAICAFLPGSFTCACIDGYSGDGTSCFRESTILFYFLLFLNFPDIGIVSFSFSTSKRSIIAPMEEMIVAKTPPVATPVPVPTTAPAICGLLEMGLIALRCPPVPRKFKAMATLAGHSPSAARL